MTTKGKWKNATFFVGVVLLGIFVFDALINRAKVSKKPREKKQTNQKLTAKHLSLLTKAAGELNEAWESGKYPSLSQKIDACDEMHWTLELSGQDYLKCNPQLWQCYFSGQTNVKNPSVSNSEELSNVEVLGIYPEVKAYSLKPRYYRRVSDWGVEISLGIKGTKIKQSFILNDSCHSVFLPKSTYGHSQNVIGKNLKDYYRDKFLDWKNEREVFVDKYLVTKRDVFEWKVLSQRSLPEKNIFRWHEYDTTLSALEMKEYCEDKGKKVLSTRIYDAGSFFQNFEEKDKKTTRSLFPWGNRNRGILSPRAKFSDLYTEEEKSPTRENCQKVFTKNCTEYFSFKSFESNNTSWMGINDVLGGPLEYLENHETPFFNLKMSSFHFDQYSPWHLVAHRGHWNGKVEKKVFQYESSFLDEPGDPLIDESLGVAFRCMREL